MERTKKKRCGGEINKKDGEDIYEQTEEVIRTSQDYTEEFRIKEGVRQGCVMSLLLFNLYMVEIEEKLRNRGL